MRDTQAAGTSAALDETYGEIGIAVSTYNANITEKILEGAVDTLISAGLPREALRIVRVPGAWELPLAAKWLSESDRIAGVITLGAVIRGETSHDEHINRAVSLALMELMQSSGKPIAFGLLTCNTLDQAVQRAGGKVGNKGEEAAQALVAMLALRRSIGERSCA